MLLPDINSYVTQKFWHTPLSTISLWHWCITILLLVEEHSFNLTFSFLLLLSSLFPLVNYPHYVYLSNLPHSRCFIYIFCLYDISLVLSFLYFLFGPTNKGCYVKHKLESTNCNKYLKNQKYFCLSIPFIIILSFTLREMKEKDVPMSNMKYFCLIYLIKFHDYCSQTQLSSSLSQ